MEQRLNTVKEKKASDEVEMTLGLLKQAKQIRTVMIFKEDTDLQPV